MGSHLVPILLNRGHEVWSLYRYVSNRRPNTEANVVYGDVRDHIFINKTLPEINPEIIIHLAALTPVSLSYERPIEYTETNYIGTLNLAHAAMKCTNLRMFIYNSTSECYGIQEDFPINESAELRPNTPYAVSKAAAEMYFKYYLGPGYNFPYFLFTPFNSYGRKDTNHFVIESIVTQMLSGDIVHIGDIRPVRDFVHIDDVMAAYDKVINGVENIVGDKYIMTNTKMNVCTGRGISIESLLGLVAQELDWNGTVKPQTTYHRPTEIPKLIGDNTYAQMTFHWRPEIELEDGIRKTIEYWREKLRK